MKIPVGVIKAIDELFRKKTEMKMLKADIDELSSTVKKFMSDHGLDIIEGKKAQAIYSTREGNEIDPEAYFDAIGGDVDKLLSSVTVRMDPKDDYSGARSFLGEDDISSICHTVDIPVLRIKKLAPMKVEAPVVAAPKRMRKLATTP